MDYVRPIVAGNTVPERGRNFNNSKPLADRGYCQRNFNAEAAFEFAANSLKQRAARRSLTR